MAATSVEKVWRSFEKVREMWEMEAVAAASQRESKKDRNEEDRGRKRKRKNGLRKWKRRGGQSRRS